METPIPPLYAPGQPLAPGELQLTGDTALQLRLSWGQPFTLPGETVSYFLLIQNQATGWNKTVGRLTETSYTHSLSEAEALACHTFLFSVSSRNAVGLSLNSSSAQAVHPSGQSTPSGGSRNLKRGVPTLRMTIMQASMSVPPY